MGFLGNLWDSVKGTAKQVSLDKVTELGEQLATKGKDLVEEGKGAVEKWANWVKEKTPDSIDGIVDQVAAQGKELVEKAGDKLEDVAKDTVASAEHAADKATETTETHTDETATPAA